VFRTSTDHHVVYKYSVGTFTHSVTGHTEKTNARMLQKYTQSYRLLHCCCEHGLPSHIIS